MKKLITAIITAAAVTSTAGAQQLISVPDVQSGIFAVYGADGALRGVYNIENETAALPDNTYTDSDFARVWDWEKIYTYAPPAETQNPSETQKPSETPNPSETQKPSYPDIYERGIDAVTAFWAVDSVSLASDKNGGQCYIMSAFHQGAQREITLPDDLTLAAAPDAYQSLVGAKPTALKAGDVVQLTFNLQSEVSAAALVYRPLAHFPDGTDSFAPLISANGAVAGISTQTVYPARSGKYSFALGVISGKSSDVITLCGADGGVIDDFDIPNNAVIYVCDMSEKNPTVALGTRADLMKSPVSGENLDDAGNITAYSGEDIYNLALIRLVDNTVTDVITYTNYNY